MPSLHLIPSAMLAATLAAALAAPTCTPEVCDGVDNDADGRVDEGYDADGDGHLDASACPSPLGDDCDDADPSIFPGSADAPPDGDDGDCDGRVDEGPGITPLHALSDDLDEGSRADNGVIQGLNGALYGTTVYGGAAADGTLFRVGPDGRLTVLHQFDFTSGCQPIGRLAQAPDGTLFGVTRDCGRTAFGGDGDGTLFSITPQGVFRVLQVFALGPGVLQTGGWPGGGLVLADDGLLYGTTRGGGDYTCSGSSCSDSAGGTLYRVDPATGEVTVLHVFDTATEGSSTWGEPIQGSDGLLYGVAGSGGANGWGTLWSSTLDGDVRVVHHFEGFDADVPTGGLVEGEDGALYGASLYGGIYGEGTLFRVTKDGDAQVLHTFHYGGGALGYWPLTWLTDVGDGWLYGTTAGEVAGGSVNVCDPAVPASCGTTFRISYDGEYQALHLFEPRDGLPYWIKAGLTLARDGRLYGTSSGDDVNGDGLIFSFAPPH